MSNISENPQIETEVFIASATPDIYLSNAFRIAGVPVDATEREMARQVEKLKMMQKYGNGSQPDGGIYNEDAIRAAMQRLRDPEHRILDEFFWFWPQNLGQSRTDEALIALTKCDMKKATEIWTTRAKSSNTNVSIHNLAVLSHMDALDLENTSFSQKLAESEKKHRDKYWQDAFKRWKVLLEEEVFWSRLTGRIRELNDPRLTTGMARRMRMNLPLVLLSINAKLAVRFAELGEFEEAKRHMKIMQESGFGQNVIDEANRKALEHIRERVKALCKVADTDSSADAENADKVGRHLLEQVEPVLAIMDCLLPAGNPTRDGSHDEVAICALSCEIVFGNKTSDWSKSLEFLNRVHSIAVTDTARSRIEQNIEIFKSNIEYHSMYKTCWFCKKNTCVDSAGIEVKMHGNVRKEWAGYNMTRTVWNYVTIKVPRCTECKTIHSRRSIAIAICIVTIIATLFLYDNVISSILEFMNMEIDDAYNGHYFLSIAALSITTGLLANFLIRKNFIKNNTNSLSESKKNNFPLIQSKLKEGWAFGERPNTQ